MNTIVGAICACYSFLLVLYPRSLRDAYASEMVDTLRRHLLDSFTAAGVLGISRATCEAFCELVVIGVPSRLNQAAFAVFSLAISTSFATLYTLAMVLHNPDVLDPLMRRLGLQCP
jgi:hypothetical protein